MAEKDSSYAPEVLGTVIAFVLPGFITLWLIAHFVPQSAAAVWLTTAQDKQTTVGAFLFAGLASLALGLVLSGLRYVIYEASGLLTVLGAPPRSKDLDHRSRKENEAAYREITENHYKFYLFYSNTSTALLALIPVLWAHLDAATWVAFGVLQFVLIVSARDAIIRTREKQQILLGIYDPKKKSA